MNYIYGNISADHQVDINDHTQVEQRPSADMTYDEGCVVSVAPYQMICRQFRKFGECGAQFNVRKILIMSKLTYQAL